MVEKCNRKLQMMIDNGFDVYSVAYHVIFHIIYEVGFLSPPLKVNYTVKQSHGGQSGSLLSAVVRVVINGQDTLHQMKLIIDSLAGDASGTQSSLPY
eukprot:4541742-Amphidinium_carterae.1